MVDTFDPPPVGRSKEEDFDPTIHLEVTNEEDEKVEEEEVNLLDEDENANKV